MSPAAQKKYMTAAKWGRIINLSSTSEFRDAAVKGIAVGRSGKPEDIANAVSFLEGDRAEFN